MAELENIIESVISSPESMSKIMDIVKMFGDGGDAAPLPEKETAPSLEGIVGRGGGVDSEMLTKIMELLGNYNADDRRIRLLCAIRPYIKDEDSLHIDRAIHIVKLSRVAKSVLRDFLK